MIKKAVFINLKQYREALQLKKLDHFIFR